MDLSKYKIIRSNKFPLPKKTKQVKNSNKPSFVTTIALISENDGEHESYQIHLQNNNQNANMNVLIFNDHEYLSRQFNACFYREDNQSNALIANQIEHDAMQSYNNLIIFNVLDLPAIQKLIFPWKQYSNYQQSMLKTQNQKQVSNSETPQCALKAIVESVLKTKRNNTIVTLSILGVRSNGSLEDELNYQWIEESKYIEDLVKIKQKTKLKVKKFRTEIKAFDLNRQHIKQWSQAQQIFHHYSQIKQYIQLWKKQLDPVINAKIGEIYEVCELQMNDELGTIKNIHKRKYLFKINQYMQQSNLVSMKIAQLLKQRVQNIQSVFNRDFPVLMFLGDCFDRSKNYHYTLLTQIGTNQSLKQEVICLAMDLQIPGHYVYLKNYCDKNEIVQKIRQKATNFVPLTSGQRVNIKVGSGEKGFNKLKAKSINIIRQGEEIVSKSFFFDTFSSNQKKRKTYNQTYNIQNAIEQKKDLTSHIYGPYEKPSTSFQRNSISNKKQKQ